MNFAPFTLILFEIALTIATIQVNAKCYFIKIQLTYQVWNRLCKILCFRHGIFLNLGLTFFLLENTTTALFLFLVVFETFSKHKAISFFALDLHKHIYCNIFVFINTSCSCKFLGIFSKSLTRIMQNWRKNNGINEDSIGKRLNQIAS